MNIPYVDLAKQNLILKDELHACLDRVLNHGQFILGKEVDKFESEFANYIGVKYAVGVGSGTDALFLSLRSLGIGLGDEVITPSCSYLASTSAISLVGAKPIFADVSRDLTIDIERVRSLINSRTKAIIAVHLSGNSCDLGGLKKISRDHNIPIIEDAAQAVGSEYKEKKIGSFGYTGCFSLHPLKNLGAIGDGGIITTNDKKVYDFLILARNHGHSSRDQCEFWSHNMRLDALQAAFLSVKLNNLDKVINRRRDIAQLYKNHLAGIVSLPEERNHTKHSYHTFVVQSPERNSLMKYLSEKGIETKIHYPTPTHLLQAAKNEKINKGSLKITNKLSDEMLSLPIGEYLLDEEIEYICSLIIGYFQTNYSKL